MSTIYGSVIEEEADRMTDDDFKSCKSDDDVANVKLINGSKKTIKDASVMYTANG
jgi:hypothetical protein